MSTSDAPSPFSRLYAMVALGTVTGVAGVMLMRSFRGGDGGKSVAHIVTRRLEEVLALNHIARSELGSGVVLEGEYVLGSVWKRGKKGYLMEGGCVVRSKDGRVGVASLQAVGRDGRGMWGGRGKEWGGKVGVGGANGLPEGETVVPAESVLPGKFQGTCTEWNISKLVLDVPVDEEEESENEEVGRGWVMGEAWGDKIVDMYREKGFQFKRKQILPVEAERG